MSDPWAAPARAVDRPGQRPTDAGRPTDPGRPTDAGPDDASGSALHRPQDLASGGGSTEQPSAQESQVATAELPPPEHDDKPSGTDPADWAWVEEWRLGGEPVPWGPGLALAGFTAILVATAVYVLSAGLADRPVVDIAVNVLVAGGLAPALWLSRGLPVVRWIAGGAVVGVLGAWLAVLIFLT